MALEQNSLGLFYGDREVMTIEEKMDEIRTKVERIKRKHEEKRASLEYKGRYDDRFVPVPDEVVYAGDNLSDAEFRLWTVLRKHCRSKGGIRERERAYPGRERLALMMGKKSLARISELIGSLEKKGIIEVERPYLHQTNRYTVKDPPRRWVNDMEKRIKKLAEEKK